MLQEGRYDVVVCCKPYGGPGALCHFPNVRGFYLAKYLGRTGLRAGFSTYPCSNVTSRVLICSDYEGGADWLETFMPDLLALKAERLYCMADASVRGRNHEAEPMHDWFGARGGVLVHLSWNSLEPYGHFTGLGVDTEVVRYCPEEARNVIVFDFPFSQRIQAWKHFRPELLERLRDVLPSCRFLGSGPGDTPIKGYFDTWVPYGEEHSSYVRMFKGCAAFVPGCPESMGLAVAEAQVSGACIVCPPGYIHGELICSAANKTYSGGDKTFIQALKQSLAQDPKQIVQQACEKFDIFAWAWRVRRAIGLA
jgi:hypothetical protein